MSTITAEDGTEIYYQDWAERLAITASHGWPLTAGAWDGQTTFFAHSGFRAMAYDLRGPGRTKRPSWRHPWRTCHG
jgi:non-heme chloroperoxidase